MTITIEKTALLKEAWRLVNDEYIVAEMVQLPVETVLAKFAEFDAAIRY